MTDLIELPELEDRLGSPVTDPARAAALIADVSAVIEAYTGRVFTTTESTTALPVRCGTVTLPHGPVSAVDAVVDADDVAVEFEWETGRTFTIEGDYTAVTVTYTHGWDDVPAAIKAVAAQMVGRSLGTTSAMSGVTQTSLGSYSETIGSAAGAGPLGILPDERAILDIYKGAPRGRSIRLGSWV